MRCGNVECCSARGHRASSRYPYGGTYSQRAWLALSSCASVSRSLNKYLWRLSRGFICGMILRHCASSARPGRAGAPAPGRPVHLRAGAACPERPLHRWRAAVQARALPRRQPALRRLRRAAAVHRDDRSGSAASTATSTAPRGSTGRRAASAICRPRSSSGQSRTSGCGRQSPPKT